MVGTHRPKPGAAEGPTRTGAHARRRRARLHERARERRKDDPIRDVGRADGALPVKPLLLSSLDLSRVVAWQGTQLVFDRTPLEDAVTAFNSFNPCQVVLGDAALRTRKLGGTFRADNVDTFVRLLEAGFDITAEQRSDLEIVLHPKR